MSVRNKHLATLIKRLHIIENVIFHYVFALIDELGVGKRNEVVLALINERNSCHTIHLFWVDNRSVDGDIRCFFVNDVKSKLTDPAVIAVDELAGFVIPLLSGHIGGGNALALQLADFLGAVPVITTATDINRKFSVDAWAARQGLYIASLSAAKHISARILEAQVPICSDFPIVTALPEGTAEGASGEIGICISCGKREPFDETLLLVPPVLHLGIGCRREIPCQTIEDAVNLVCRENGIHPKAIRQVASIDLKADEAGLLEFCEKRGLPAVFYSAQELKSLPGEFTPSERVLRVTGVDNVCERAAMMGAETLLVRKTAMNGVTVAIAQEHWEVRFE